ncbi:MAG: hypothetical protein ACJAZS_000342 [Alteromonas naphthalenivorans]|jgi:hypothetical protein
MFWTKKYFLGFLFLLNGVTHTQTLLVGDSAAATGDTFSFNVLAKYFNASKNNLFVGRESATNAGDSTNVKKYAISGLNDGATTFIPLAPEKSFVNGVENSDNPLFGEQILELSFFTGNPLAVRADAPTNLYWLASGFSPTTSVLKIEDVKDAQGATDAAGSTTAGIVKIAGFGSYAFAAVKPNGGVFGASGSGIALIAKASGGKSLEQIAAVARDAGVKAVPINTGIAQLKINTALVSIDTSIIDMHWDDVLCRLYIAVKATGDTGGSDGALGVIMAYLKVEGGVQKLNFTAFAPADSAVFNNKTYIIGGSGTSTVADIQKIRTMHTTTGVSYLITLGNADSADANKTVSALPLVNKQPASIIDGNVSYLIDTAHGALASKIINVGTNLKEYFQTTGEIACFAGRGFQTAASATADLTIQSEKPAQVGDADAPGIVLDMQVFKDTVYISVNGDDNEAQVFSSQALLDVNGAIKAWTPWRAVMRPVTAANRVYGMGYQPSIGRMHTMEGSGSTAVKQIKTSTWTKPSADGLLGGSTIDSSIGFEALLAGAFTKENGGIQGLFDFPKETTAFSQTDNEKLSMMIATGYKKVMFIETGQDDVSNDFLPHIGDFSHADNITITDGVLDAVRTENTKIVTISGGVLDTVGAISTATIMNATAPNGGYIIVGGVGGVAILRATADGAGWAAGDLQKSFVGIGTNKSFAIIGSYSNVRKVIADDQFLYVLTNKTFDRIPASQLNGAITPTVLATPTDLGLAVFDSFSDVLVSSKLALLATSKGLYRTGNAKNISTETSVANVDWSVITLSEGPIPITRLVATSTTMLETDFAKIAGGGMVYALASSVGDQLSAVYRLATRDISASAIAATTVEFIPDHILSSTVGPYGHLGGYRNYFTTDGALPVITQSMYNTTAALTQAFSSQMRAGNPVTPRALTPITLANGQTEIGKLVSNSALGSKIIPTNDGSLILE